MKLVLELSLRLERRRIEELHGDELAVPENSPENGAGPAFSDGVRLAELVRSGFELLVGEFLQLRERRSGGIEWVGARAVDEREPEVVEEVKKRE